MLQLGLVRNVEVVIIIIRCHSGTGKWTDLARNCLGIDIAEYIFRLQDTIKWPISLIASLHEPDILFVTRQRCRVSIVLKGIQAMQHKQEK